MQVECAPPTCPKSERHSMDGPMRPLGILRHGLTFEHITPEALRGFSREQMIRDIGLRWLASCVIPRVVFVADDQQQQPG